MGKAHCIKFKFAYIFSNNHFVIWFIDFVMNARKLKIIYTESHVRMSSLSVIFDAPLFHSNKHGRRIFSSRNSLGRHLLDVLSSLFTCWEYSWEATYWLFAVSSITVACLRHTMACYVCALKTCFESVLVCLKNHTNSLIQYSTLGVCSYNEHAHRFDNNNIYHNVLE